MNNKRKKQDYKEYILELENGGSIMFYHNLPDIFGLDIEGAVTNWEVRTNTFTVESLKKYVASKNTGYEIITKEEYSELK